MRRRLAQVPAIRNLVAVVLKRMYGADIIDTDKGRDDPADAGEHLHYAPSGWLRLKVAIPKRELSRADVFVDVGSGKGRVVVLAAMHYPFKRVIGVEFVEEFNAVARANVERNRPKMRARDVELVTAAALQWELPDDLTIVYMFNPLTGDLFVHFVERLIAFVDRRQRGVRLIYVNPTQHESLVATGRVTELPPPRGLLARMRGVPPSEMRRYDIRPVRPRERAGD